MVCAYYNQRARFFARERGRLREEEGVRGPSAGGKIGV